VRLRSNLMAQRDRFQEQRSAGSGFASDDRDHSACQLRHEGGYRQEFKTTNEFMWIRF
jgi:hypothetical protein